LFLGDVRGLNGSEAGQLLNVKMDLFIEKKLKKEDVFPNVKLMKLALVG